MRQARLKARTDQPVGYYHCLSRVVERRFLWEDQDREQFAAYMRLYAQFCGVRILTYCILSNHFHLLVEVPRRPDILPPDEELLQKLHWLYGPRYAQAVREQLLTLPAAEAAVLRERYFRRMGDISLFMNMCDAGCDILWTGCLRRTGSDLVRSGRTGRVSYGIWRTPPYTVYGI